MEYNEMPLHLEVEYNRGLIVVHDHQKQDVRIITVPDDPEEEMDWLAF